MLAQFLWNHHLHEQGDQICFTFLQKRADSDFAGAMVKAKEGRPA